MSAHAHLTRIKLTGVCPPARGAVIAELTRGHPAPVWLVITEDLKHAEQLAEDLAFFHRSAGGNPAAIETIVFPESIPDSRDMREAFAASADRTTVLSRLRSARSVPSSQLSALGSQLLILTTPAALLQPVPALEAFSTREITITRGQSQPFAALLETLQSLDYDSEAVCESPGHYAIRGGIIDVYPITASQPYRLDFFGDEIEDIRAFDPVTQRSGEQIDTITLSASPRLKLDASKTGIADYLSPLTQLVFVEPASLDEEFSSFAREGFDQLSPILLKASGAFGLADIDEAAALFDGDGVTEITWDTESLVHHRTYPSDDLVAQERLSAEEDARRTFLTQLVAWKKDGYGLAFVVSKEGEEQRVKEILAEDPRFKGLQPLWVRGTLNEGFRCTYRAGAGLLWSTLPKRKLGEIGGLVLVTETELFGRQRTRRVTGTQQRALVTRAQVDQLLDFSELVEGDFVVHLQHGIALYRGLTKLDTRDGQREVISLEFDDGVTLHVPLQESHLISRYVGLGKAKPQLGKVGSGRWEKTRQAAERATIDLAADLLKIQAQREAQPGHAFPPDNDWQKEFEGSFPFTETKDQLTAIEATKADLERARPMDRLICGDVGFGKTEVAIRAAMKVVTGGRQVLLLALRVEADQLRRELAHRLAGARLQVRPRLAAELGERRRSGVGEELVRADENIDLAGGGGGKDARALGLGAEAADHLDG
ncbi:MAG: CarD family transcriptional regulator, partial [Rariglobus sp.]